MNKYLSMQYINMIICLNRTTENEVLRPYSEWLVHPSDSANWRQSAHRKIPAPSPNSTRHGEYMNKPY